MKTLRRSWVWPRFRRGEVADAVTGMGSARIFAPCVNTGGEQQRHRHRIKHDDKRQGDEPDRSLKIRGGYTDHLREISQRSDLRLGASALRINLRLFDLEATERLGLTLTLGRDLSAFTPLLVSDCHRPEETTEPRRLLNGCVDLADAAIKVGDRPVWIARRASISAVLSARARSVDAMWSR